MQRWFIAFVKFVQEHVEREFCSLFQKEIVPG